MKILICEDELIIAEYLKEVCTIAQHEVIGIVSSHAAATLAAELHRPTVALMDINLEGNMEGIQLAMTLRNNYDIPSIFITAYDDIHTINLAVEAQPLAYLVKPVDRGTLIANLKLVAAKLNLPKESQAPIKLIIGKDTLMLELENLLYVEAFANYMELHFLDRKSTILRTTLSHLASELPTQFVRIHKSYIVNRKYLTTISHLRAIVGSKTLPVGRSYYQSITLE